MMPSSGQINVSNAESTRTGLASQIINNPSRGKSPANMANRQPILLLTSCLLSQCPPRGSYWRIAYRRPALTLSLETCKPSYLWGLSSAVLGASACTDRLAPEPGDRLVYSPRSCFFLA